MWRFKVDESMMEKMREIEKEFTNKKTDWSRVPKAERIFNGIQNEDGSFTYECDFPGFNKDNVEIEIVGDNILKITGETEKRKMDKKLIIGYAIGDVDASIKDGVVTLKITELKEKVTKVIVK